MRVLGYTRASTIEQIEGAGLTAQQNAITGECFRRDWTLLEIIEDAGHSGKNLKRPGVLRALEMLEKGAADGLIVARLDRLSRSMLDFTSIMALSQKQKWALVALDCAVDTTTPAGEAMANVLATFAQFERRLISQRVTEALAVKRAQGVRLGRPLSVPPEIRARIRAERASGDSFRVIAERLNAEQVACGQGGVRWWPSSVRASGLAVG